MIKDEVRFYICLVLGYSLMMIGIWLPPVGVISNSVIMASGILLCIGALSIGIDLKGIIHEFRLMKDDALRTKELDKENEKEEE